MKIRYLWIMAWLLTVAPSLMAEAGMNEVIRGKKSLLEFYKREFKELFKECKYAEEQDLRDKIAGLKEKLEETKLRGSAQEHKKAMDKALSIQNEKIRQEMIDVANAARSKKPSRVEILNITREISIHGSNLKKLERLKKSVERTRRAIANTQDVVKLNKGYCSLVKIALDFSDLKTEIALKVKAGGKFKASKSGMSMQVLGDGMEKARKVSLTDFMALMQGGKSKPKRSARKRKPRHRRQTANERMYSQKNVTKGKCYYRHTKEKKARLLQCILVLTNQAVEAPEDFFPVEGEPANKKPEPAAKKKAQPAAKNKDLFRQLDPKPPSWQKIKDDIGNLELTGELARSELVLLEKALRNLSVFLESSEKAGKGNKSIARSAQRVTRELGKLVQGRYNCALLLSESSKLLKPQEGNIDPIVVNRMNVLDQLQNQFKNSMGLYLTHRGILNRGREASFRELVSYQKRPKKK